jgi:uncharacterized RDD family membrane protein YckC
MIEMDYSSPSETDSTEKLELPQWRQDLSRRLQEIKQKRVAGSEGGNLRSPTKPILQGIERRPKAEGTKDGAAKSPPLPRAPRGVPRLVRPAPSPEVQATQKRATAKPTPPAEEPPELPLFQSIQPETKPPEEPVPVEVDLQKMPAVTEAEQQNVESLINGIIARQAEQGPYATFPERRDSMPQAPVPLEDRLILLSRTLSGLVDLLVVAICTGVFIIAADMASGIDIFDKRSLIVYSLLLFAIFLVYSTFFLGTANQTIGMMLTDLRVVDSWEKRPSMRQILGRCFAYLVSLLLFGTGLLWGCFDRQSRCLHDRLSDTRVIRI